MLRTPDVPPNPSVLSRETTATTTSATFQIKNAKLCVPMAGLSINDKIKFLGH